MCLAVPGCLLSIDGDDPLMRSGRVSFGGVIRVVQLAYVPGAQVGDYLVVHVGFAISVLDQQQAQRVLDDLEAAGVLDGGSSKR